MISGVCFGDYQAPCVRHWEGQSHDFTMTADGPWGQVTGKGAGCFDALTDLRT